MGKTGIIMLLLVLVSLYSFQLSAAEPLNVFVSILPQKHFVEAVGGERVRVEVMVEPGYSPATYELRTRQLKALEETEIYFRIGVPFEEGWMERIKASNPEMKVVDTREGIEMQPMTAAVNGSDQHCCQGPRDPHIWLDPLLVKKQAATMASALCDLDPGHCADYNFRLEDFKGKLDRLDREVARELEELDSRKMMVFHPAWGYFASRYDLKQLPIEVEGKEPGPRTMAEIIDRAREGEIGVIFVQKEFSTAAAERIAGELGIEVIAINPLAEDYISNLKQIAERLAGEL